MGEKVTNEFLPRDPTKALVDVKEELYDRLGVLRQCVNGRAGAYDQLDYQMMNEMEFLRGLLDKMEKSL